MSAPPKHTSTGATHSSRPVVAAISALALMGLGLGGYPAAQAAPAPAPTGQSAQALAAADTKAPAKPGAITYTFQGSIPSLTWPANTEADLAGYTVERKIASGAYELVAPAAGQVLTDTRVTDTTAPAKKFITYRVRAVDTSGNTSAGSLVTFKTPVGDTTPPAKPGALTVVFDAAKVPTLTWPANTEPDLAGYLLERKGLDGSYVQIAPSAGAPLNVPTFRDTSAVAGFQATYRVRAVDVVGNASPTRSLSVWVPRTAATTATTLTVGPNRTFAALATALAAIPSTSTAAYTIAVFPGTYREKLTVSRPDVTILGMGTTPDQVSIEWDDAAGTPKREDPTTTYGTSGSATLYVRAADVTLRNLTVANTFDEAANPAIANQQAVALRVTSDRFIARQVRLLGNQDTLLADSANTATIARQYFVDSAISGDVDYLFGRATAVFQRVTFTSLDRGQSNNGYVVAPSTDIANPYGYLIVDSKMVSPAAAGTVHLGRPWHPSADPNAIGATIIRDTVLPAAIDATEPWTDMSGFSWRDARFFEYRNSGPGAAVNANRPQLSDVQAAQHTPAVYLAGDDGWNPLVPQPTSAPATPVDPTATTTGTTPASTAVAFTWADDVSPMVTGWTVFRAVNGGAFEPVATVAVPAYTDTAVALGSAYRYYVVALSRNGTSSAASSTVEVTVVAPPRVVDVTVDPAATPNGTTVFTTVAAALTAAPAGTATDPTVIEIKPGTYREVVASTRANLVITGATSNPRDVVISFDNANGTPTGPTTCPAVTASTCGTYGSATVTLSGNGVRVENLTIANTFRRADHPEIGQFNTQAVALRAIGDRQVFTNVRLLGEQDTLSADSAGAISTTGTGYTRQYYVDSYIEGNVDYVFGRATALFQRVTFHTTNRASGYVFAPSTASLAKGYLVVDSRLSSDNDPGAIAFARPWRAWSDGTQPDTSRGQVILRDTWISNGFNLTHPWADMAPNLWTDGRFTEYRMTGPGAVAGADRPVLSDADAAQATPALWLAGSDGWDPTVPAPAQTAPAPPTGTAASAADGAALLTWDDNAEADVVGYRILQNGSPVATSTRNSATVTGLTNGTAYTFTVTAFDAAGNESPASAPTTVTPAMTVNATVGQGAQYASLQEALAAAPATGQWTVQVLPGTYAGTTTVSRSNVRVVGGAASVADVVLTNATATPTLAITGNNVTIEGVTVINSAGVNNSPALYMTGTQVLVRNAALTGTNRTVWADVPTAGATSAQMIVGSTSTGTTQIVLGRATLVISASAIRVLATSGLVLVPSTTAVGGKGFLIIGSTITPVAATDVRLGGGYAQGVTTVDNAPQAWIVGTRMDAGIKANPWMDFNGFAWLSGRFAESGTTGAGAGSVGDPNRPQLTDAQAATATVSDWLGTGTWYAATS